MKIRINFLWFLMMAFFSRESIALSCKVSAKYMLERVDQNKNLVIYYLRPYISCEGGSIIYRIIQDPYKKYDQYLTNLFLCKSIFKNTTLSAWSLFDKDKDAKYTIENYSLPRFEFSYTYIKANDVFKIKTRKTDTGNQERYYEWNDDFTPIPYSQFNGEVDVMQVLRCTNTDAHA